MSHSPADPHDRHQVLDRQSTYRQQLSRLDRLIHFGGSLSGNERHCAFLNLGPDREGRVRFATVSAVTGLDFADDGRALGLTDWDGDGDVDIWCTNRTAPRVRLLRNDLSGSGGFLALQLQGTTCNRDAIGARIEVIPAGAAAARPLIKQLRGGEGFLGQSSKWVHFGLGSIDAIERVVVHWPGGSAEVFREIQPNGFFHLRQGRGKALRLDVRRHELPASVPAVRVPPTTDQAHVLLTSRIPLPRLGYQTIDGQSRTVGQEPGAITLLHLWATWCSPCVEELMRWDRHRAELRAMGVDVLALSADRPAAGEDDAAVLARIGMFAQRHGLSLPMGRAPDELIRRLQLLDDYLFAQKRPVPIPCTFIIDTHGRLAGVYRGVVDLERIRRDVGCLGLEARALYEASLPFPGTWYRPVGARVPLVVPASLFVHGYPEDAADYLLAHSQSLKRQDGFVPLAGQLAASLEGKGQRRAAIRLCQAALDEDPDNVPIMNNLAWYLSHLPDGSDSEIAMAVTWARRAAQQTQFRVPEVLDTLAAAYARSGDYEQAVAMLDQAITLARTRGDSQLVQSLDRARQRYQARQAPPP